MLNYKKLPKNIKKTAEKYKKNCQLTAFPKKLVEMLLIRRDRIIVFHLAQLRAVGLDCREVGVKRRNRSYIYVLFQQPIHCFKL